MSNAVYWRIRAGFSLALLIVLAILGSLVVVRVDLFWACRLPIVEGIALAGVALLLLARFVSSRTEPLASPDQDLVATDQPDRPLAFFRSLAYWGCMLLASAFPILYLAEHVFNERQAAPPVPARVNKPQKVVELTKPAPVARLPGEFPALRVNGYVCNGVRSTVILNGQTLSIGESIQGVKVLSISSGGIAVEMDGSRKWLATAR